MTPPIFPPYLAYGKLTPESVCKDGDCFSASYELLGIPVMKVNCQASYVEILETLNDQRLAMSRGENLEKTLMRHFSATRQYDNPVYWFLVEKVSGLGEVYIQHDIEKQKQLYVFYPAAYMYIIRIPIPIICFSSFSEALNDQDVCKKIRYVYKSNLRFYWKNGNENGLELLILEVVVPVALLFETVEFLFAKKVIYKSIVFRPIIQNVIHKAMTLQSVFVGKEKDNWNRYIIHYSNSI